MIIKETPEDFVVREIYDLSGVGGHGTFAYYRVEKRGLSTIDAAVRLAAAAGVATDAVRFAGLKDKQAMTAQVMSVEGGRVVNIKESDLAIVSIGGADEPAAGDRLFGNEFEITIRDLSKDESNRFMDGLAAVAEFGVPNYFDDQRFGAARSGKGFPARELVLGRADEALRLLVATPASIDFGEHRERKQQLARAWGDWRKCLQLARGWHEEAVFGHLLENSGDYRGALKHVPRRERLMQLFAYQSYLWNHALDALVRNICKDPVELECELGRLAAWARLDKSDLEYFENVDLRLPAHGTKCNDSRAQRALEDALKAEGIVMDQLQIDGIRGFEFREETRPAILLPDVVEADDPSDDERRSGQFKINLKLSLPKGAYATLILKRAAVAGAEN